MDTGQVLPFLGRQADAHRRQNIVWLVALSYFFQGFYFLGSGIYAAAAMANWEVPVTTQATVIAIIGLPIYLKSLPGLLSDRQPIGKLGRRKPYMAIGMLLYLPAFLILITQQSFGAPWIGGILATLLAWSLVDTCLDALIVDLTPQYRTTRVQGAAWTGRFAGMALTSLIVPLLGPRIGWTPVLLFLCICALIQTGFALMIRENPSENLHPAEMEPIRVILRRVFSQPVIWYGLLFMMFFFASRGFSNLVNIYLLTELGWNRTPETMQLFGVTNIIQLVGSAVGAALLIRLPSRYLTSLKFFVGYTLAFWILTLPWLWVYQNPDQITTILFARLLFGFGSGVGIGLGLAIAMRLCPKYLEGFMFAIMVSAQNFGDLTLAPKTITAFMQPLGGLVPAFFSLIIYSILGLIFLRPVLKSLRAAGEASTAMPV